MAAATRATRPAGAGTNDVQASAAATAVARPLALSSHEPTLIGEVTLKTRSMLTKRDGLPRSEIRSAGLAPTPATALSHARRASASLPGACATSAGIAGAPPERLVAGGLGEQREHRRRAAHAAGEEVERDLGLPDRLLEHRPAVVRAPVGARDGRALGAHRFAPDALTASSPRARPPRSRRQAPPPPRPWPPRSSSGRAS